MPNQITIPKAFANGIITDFGAKGQAWIDELPDIIRRYCLEWDLAIDGAAAHGHLSLVVPVIRDNERLVLKLAWPDESSKSEIIALQVWRGHGAVQLFDVNENDGVMLLERLDSSRTLNDVGIDEAVQTASKLLRRLAIPAPDTLPRLSDYAKQLPNIMRADWRQLTNLFDEGILDAACTKAMLLSSSTSDTIVNHDLHYGNVLAGTREPWLAIDPKVFAGDIEYAVAPLLMRRFDELGKAGLSGRLEQIAHIAQLDQQSAKDWTLVWCVKYWIWALGMGLTEDPKVCQVIVEWALED